MTARHRLAFLPPAIALAVLWAVATTVGPFADTTVNDLFVYRSYADLLAGGGLPYVDFGFEYPPLAALPIWLAGLPGRDEATYAVSFAVLMAGWALAGQQLAARLAGGRRAGLQVAWMLALAPVVIGASVRTHFDALPIAIALGGLLALARERPDLGFVLLGLGTMTKLFPGLLAVVAVVWLVARGERRAALRGAVIFTAIVVLVSLPLSGSGYVDSFRFHLERPVQIESTPASVLFALGDSQVTGTNLRPDRFKSNGLDGGQADLVAMLFAAALVLTLGWVIALAARGRDARHLVLTGFAALLAFVTLGKVFSPQYVIWLAPFAALAWVWGERAVAALTAVAIVLTHVEFPSRYVDLINERTNVILVVAVRNVLLLAALALLAGSLRGANRRATPVSRSPRDTARSVHVTRSLPLLVALTCCALGAPVNASAQVEFSTAVEPAQVTYPQQRALTYRLTMTTGEREEHLSVAPQGVPFANGAGVTLEGPGTLGFGIHADPPATLAECSRSRMGTPLLRFYTVVLPPRTTSMLISRYTLIAAPWPGADLRLGYAFDSLSQDPAVPITFTPPQPLYSPRPELAGLSGVHITLTTRPVSRLGYPARVRLGGSVLVRGRADPGVAGDRIILRASSRNRRTITIATTRVRPDGRFSARWRPRRRGTYGLYAVYHSQRQSRSNASTPCDLPVAAR